MAAGRLLAPGGDEASMRIRVHLLAAALGVLACAACTHHNEPVGAEAGAADGGPDGSASDGGAADGGAGDAATADVAPADAGPPNQPPTVQWLQPADGSVALLGTKVDFVAQVADDTTEPADLGLTVTLTGTAAPDGFVPAVDAGGKVTLATAALPAGKNTLVLKVYDGDGAATSASLTVLVNTAPGAPVVSISPAAPTSADDLKAVLEAPAIDPESGPLGPSQHAWEWRRGMEVVADLTGPLVPADRTKAGETWTVVARGSDGHAQGLEGSASVKIDNAAPGVPVLALSPAQPTVASQVACQIAQPAVDPDGDAVAYLVRWTLDGEPLPAAGTATTVTLASAESGVWKAVVPVKKGQVLGCRANATDGVSVGLMAEVTVALASFDPCVGGSSGCGLGTACTPTDGAEAACPCAQGYLAGFGGCVDVDECLGDGASCAAHAVCVNEPGSWSCACAPGWKGPGTVAGGCTDIDECAAAGGDALCNPLAKCANTAGGYLCLCQDGYAGDGAASGTCADVDECAQGLAVCDLAAACTNTVGSYACVCGPGWKGDGKKCADVDECADGTAACDLAATCTNTDGGYTCTCKPGYSGDGQNCVDIDECKAGAYACHPHATCANLPGSYLCQCDAGWMGDGLLCEDVDECKAGTHNCSPEATCGNTKGGFDCTCKTGWQGTGLGANGCVDVDECQTGQYVCATSATCSNLEGSYLCQCKPGWIGDGKLCDDVDECAQGTATCHAAAQCLNTPGAYVCTCKPGWSGDGADCTPDGT